MLSELAAAFRGALAGKRKRLQGRTAELLRELAKDHPGLAGEGLELVADLGQGSALCLYQESVRLRLAGPASYAVAATALKAAEEARRSNDDAAFIEACHQALTCQEPFPQRMAREARAERHCRQGDYAKALAMLGPLNGFDSPHVDFSAGLLIAVRRPREAAALWSDPPEVWPRDVFKKAWALYLAKDNRAATRILFAARQRKGCFYSDELQTEAKVLAAFLAGRSNALPEGWDQRFGPIPHPQAHETNLAVFKGVKALRVASVAAQLHRLAHGEDLALAKLLFKEASERRTAGEVHERALHGSRLREGIAILDRVKGPNDPGTLPHLRDLFWASTGDEHWATAERYLSMSPADDAAAAMASRLAAHLAETDSGRALTLALTWLERCLKAGHREWELAHTVAQLQRHQGNSVEEALRLKQTLELFNPEDDYDEGRQFALKMELNSALKRAGTPDAALEKELATARAGWATQWKKGRGAGPQRAIGLLEPYLRPGARYVDAPFDVMEAAGNALGWRFLKMRINARPAHGVLIETCRPHAVETTFSGYAASDVTIESLETKDTEQIREAFAPTADDVGAHEGGRVYFWWD